MTLFNYLHDSKNMQEDNEIYVDNMNKDSLAHKKTFTHILKH